MVLEVLFSVLMQQMKEDRVYYTAPPHQSDQLVPPEVLTGSDVVRVCRATDQRSATFCEAYISGVFDATTDLADAQAGTAAFCVPEGISIQQMAALVSAFIANDRSLWSSRSGGSVVVAIRDMYPCGETPAG